MTVFAVALQILQFLLSHKEDIRALILAIEGLVSDMPGSQKAQAAKGYIAAALAIEDKIDAAWPIVAPIFNALVASVKK